MVLLHIQCGKPPYVAPEVLRREGYNSAGGAEMGRQMDLSHRKSARLHARRREAAGSETEAVDNGGWVCRREARRWRL
nr:CBL-interacting serine/threonine-protein kinase 11-like [Ipomoea trifida]